MEKTLVEITDDLRREGYTEDFNLRRDCLDCRGGAITLSHDEFKVDKFFRLEGATDPSDQVIVYAISSLDKGLKGILVNSYGIYADPIANEMMARLHLKN